jgi:Lon protease-like protein
MFPPKKKKKVDYEALNSALMRIPRMDVTVARSLIDIGVREIYDLHGRDPEVLLEEAKRKRGNLPPDHVQYLRMAVYYAEHDEPETALMHPSSWACKIMIMHQIEIPREVPVMTLSQTVLFPQAMMPLYIFEPRYREMLNRVLEGNRIFAVAALDEDEADAEVLETPCNVAGIGIVRACKQNTDGTSNLIIQGLARVEFEAIIAEEPYRKARIHQIISESGGPTSALERIQPGIIRLIQTQIRLGAPIPEEVLQFLSNIREPENILDLAIYTLCPSGRLKQELLETRGILPRYARFEVFLKSEISRLKLDQDLKGGLDEDQIGNN